VREQPEHVLVRHEIAVIVPLEREEEAVIQEPARVVEELAKRHGPPVVGELRDAAANVIVEADLAVADQEEHRRGVELLLHRREVEGGRVSDQHVMVEVGVSVALREHDLARAVDADAAPEAVA